MPTNDPVLLEPHYPAAEVRADLLVFVFRQYVLSPNRLHDSVPSAGSFVAVRLLVDLLREPVLAIRTRDDLQWV